jgi:hypothetical protein
MCKKIDVKMALPEAGKTPFIGHTDDNILIDRAVSY